MRPFFPLCLFPHLFCIRKLFPLPLPFCRLQYLVLKSCYLGVQAPPKTQQNLPENGLWLKMTPQPWLWPHQGSPQSWSDRLMWWPGIPPPSSEGRLCPRTWIFPQGEALGAVLVFSWTNLGSSSFLCPKNPSLISPWSRRCWLSSLNISS